MATGSNDPAIRLMREIAESALAAQTVNRTASDANDLETRGVSGRTIDLLAFELLFDDSVSDDVALKGLMQDALRD